MALWDLKPSTRTDLGSASACTDQAFHKQFLVRLCTQNTELSPSPQSDTQEGAVPVRNRQSRERADPPVMGKGRSPRMLPRAHSLCLLPSFGVPPRCGGSMVPYRDREPGSPFLLTLLVRGDAGGHPGALGRCWALLLAEGPGLLSPAEGGPQPSPAVPHSPAVPQPHQAVPLLCPALPSGTHQKGRWCPASPSWLV